jgi:hypothetical protein
VTDLSGRSMERLKGSQHGGQAGFRRGFHSGRYQWHADLLDDLKAEVFMRQLVAGCSLAAILLSPFLAFGVNPYVAFSVVRLEKKPAPEFSPPLAGGQVVQLSDYRGKVVLLGFFKTY